MSMPSLNFDPVTVRESVDRHQASPEVSTERYVRSRHIELGRSVLQKLRVYLDKRYWILLRDAAFRRPSAGAAHSLLASLRRGVGFGKIVCPISESLFVELLKQEDLATRRATAELIDELSDGVTLLIHPQRVATEIAHFFHSQAKLDVYPLETLVWSRLSYLFGVQHPTNETYEPAEMRVIQKAFFDHMWKCSLVEIVDRIADSPIPLFDCRDLAKRLNDGSAAHENEIKQFPQAYAAEIRGNLSLFTSVAREILERISIGESEVNISGTAIEHKQHELELLQFLCGAIKSKPVAVALRTLHIGALCHAAVRWDKKRKLVGNDLLDFHHAEAAVGYCDVFLTEAALRTMLQQRHMKLAEYFPCHVISSLEEAAEYLARVNR